MHMGHNRFAFGVCAILLIATTSCSSEDATQEAMVSILVTSPSFRDSSAIPSRFTCDGADVSPALAWTGIPEGVKSFALICDDPDAPRRTWVHWLIYNIPGTAEGLPEALAGAETLAGGMRQGINDFGRLGYGGPCPPPGAAHRYFFRVFALDQMLSLRPRVSRTELAKAMEGHTLAEGALMGVYQRMP